MCGLEVIAYYINRDRNQSTHYNATIWCICKIWDAFNLQRGAERVTCWGLIRFFSMVAKLIILTINPNFGNQSRERDLYKTEKTLNFFNSFYYSRNEWRFEIFVVGSNLFLYQTGFLHCASAMFTELRKVNGHKFSILLLERLKPKEKHFHFSVLYPIKALSQNTLYRIKLDTRQSGGNSCLSARAKTF